MNINELQNNYYQFGNKGSVWNNATHIAKVGNTTTLCDTPMLSNNWARITEHQTIGCQECLAIYNKTINKEIVTM